MKPTVGIFWIHPVSLKLIVYSEPISSVKTNLGLKKGSYFHHYIWPDVQEKIEELDRRDYRELARGRVLYDVREKTFYVYSQENPKQVHIPTSLNKKNFELVKRFKSLNRKLIKEYWDCKLGTCEFMDKIKPV